MSADALHSLVIVFAAVFSLLVWYGAALFALGQWSRHWPAVIGKVESSALRTARIANGLVTYWVEAKYSYRFGLVRNGSWIGFAQPGTASNSKLTKSKADKLRAELAPGSRVDVFVCPLWPSISVLRQGPNLAALVYVALGLSFCGSLLWIAWHVRQG